MNGVRRLDHLRFDRQVILLLAKDRRGPDLNRVTLVATILGISPKSVKKLLQAKRGGPRLSPAPASAIADLQGTAYVSTDEIERFLAEYITLALVARQVGRHSKSVQKELKMAGVVPVMEAFSLGARIYRRADVAAFIASQGMQPSMPTNIGKHAPADAVFGNKTVIPGKNGDFGESDDVIL